MVMSARVTSKSSPQLLLTNYLSHLETEIPSGSIVGERGGDTNIYHEVKPSNAPPFPIQEVYHE